MNILIFFILNFSNKYQREKQKLEHALKISRTRLIAIVSDMQYLLARLAELERELKQKQNLQELTAIVINNSPLKF